MHKKRVLTSVAGHNGVCRAHFIQFAQCFGNESVGRTVRSALCAVPHMSRSTASRVPVRLRSDSVTSQIVFDECKTYVDAEWPLFAKEQPVAC